jgi:hypothetical protein
MGNNNPEDDLVRIVVKIGEKKKDLRVKGLSNVHPIYEALTALLKQNISDSSIVSRYLKDENSLREIIAADALIDYIGPRRKQNLKPLLESGAGLKEIVESAALNIAENKRTVNGEILSPLSEVENEVLKDFYGNARSLDSNQLYISNSALGYLKGNSNKFREKKMAKYSILSAAAAVLILFSGIGGCIYGQRHSPSHTDKPNVVNTKH